ncbi:VOC family protein [Ectopseudomonas khazarica]|uniref:VOC family protein n=1 Tax=Ectopseudomonas khazarica TaxID=2502979 RepID=UPI0015C70581
MYLHRVIIFSPQPDVLAAFYCRAFGMQILSVEGSFVDIGPADSPTSRIAFHKGTRSPGTSIKLCFHSADVAAERERLMDLGIQMGKVQGNAESLCFCDGQDAEGNAFQITNRA